MKLKTRTKMTNYVVFLKNLKKNTNLQVCFDSYALHLKIQELSNANSFLYIIYALDGEAIILIPSTKMKEDKDKSIKK